MTAVRPVTVVVPVYGDLPTLVGCVESLIQNVDQSVHHVLLVNDSGPQADQIETALLSLISDQPAFSYERNPKNLGFVGTCNRAALELDSTDNDILLLNSDTVTTAGFLDELSAVLHESDHHGAVCARSNNATIASIPFRTTDPKSGRSVERTAEVHAALRDLLPRFSVSPVAMGFCLLIRRSVIREFGLFDEAFAPGYGEENDFCLRIRQHGYLSLIAHRALVFHVGGRSFGGTRREALRTAHENLLVSRHPGYTADVQRYIHLERDPVDVFADALGGPSRGPTVLVDFTEAATPLPTAAMRLIHDLSETFLQVTCSVPDRLVRGLAKRFPEVNVVPNSEVDGIWDLGVIMNAEPTASQLARMNRTSVRWVVYQPGTLEAWADGHLAEHHGTNLKRVMTELAAPPVDVERLRRRWHEMTSTPVLTAGASFPSPTRRERLRQRTERVAPRFAALAKALVKRVRSVHT